MPTVYKVLGQSAPSATTATTLYTVPAATSATTGSAHSIVMSRHGGPEVFSYTETSLRAPQAGQVTLKHTAVGVNYIDVYVRNGLYGALIELPGTPGMEAAGVITAVGPGVTEFAAGDRVAYACPPVGAYTTARTMDIGQLVKLPANISDEIAAAVMLKGMSAEYLLHRIRPVKAGDTVLVHAAAGGVGLLLCQWASRLGAKVIGTVSSESKAQLAADNGCALPIVTRDYRFADAVLEATGGKGADIVFDGLGKLAFEENLRALALCSHWVSFGQASGAHDAVAAEVRALAGVDLDRAGRQRGVDRVGRALGDPAAHGVEQVEFLVAGHAGTTPRPLARAECLTLLRSSDACTSRRIKAPGVSSSSTQRSPRARRGVNRSCWN